MKIFSQFNFRSVFIGLMMAASLAACSDDDSNIVGNGNGNGDGEPEFIELSGVLSSQTLTPDNKYLLLGQVFVRDGETLTIEPGTVIFGDKRTRATLIIDKGGKIIADGTRENPIVFTSAQEPGVRDRGDWGGGSEEHTRLNSSHVAISYAVFCLKKKKNK